MPVSSSLMNGSIYGSMPAGMTQQQRQSMVNTVPMSPSMNLLNSLGPVRPLSPLCLLLHSPRDLLPVMRVDDQWSICSKLF